MPGLKFIAALVSEIYMNVSVLNRNWGNARSGPFSHILSHNNYMCVLLCKLVHTCMHTIVVVMSHRSPLLLAKLLIVQSTHRQGDPQFPMFLVT